MTDINRVIESVAELDAGLAGQVRGYVRSRSYGLVFEEDIAESVRLYTKAPSVGDKVNILPERGREETGENRLTWMVESVSGGRAVIVRDGDKRSVPLEDVVPLAGHTDAIYPGLKVIDRVERGEKGDPFHAVINAENYHALEMLSYCCAGKVDCIYIDPPYNTGAKDWKYNNDYVGQDDQYRHSKWLAFMKRRLILSKRLLNMSGSILIVTIDEKEVSRLGMLLEQVFPEAKIQMVSSVINHHGTGRANEFSRVNEFIYFVMMGDYALSPIEKTGYVIEGQPVHWQSYRRSNPANVRPSRPSQFYPIYINRNTGRIEKIGDPITPDIDRFSVEQLEGCEAVFPVRDDGTEMMWSLVPEQARERLAKGYIKVGKHTPDKPQQYVIQFLMSGTIKDIENGNVRVTGRNEDGSVIAENVITKGMLPRTQWDMQAHDARDYGSRILKTLMGGVRFDFPKSLYAVMDCLKIAVGSKKDALIVDFFAGSGTTLHAVNLLNAQDGGKRRCVCITNNEVSAEEEKAFTKKGLRPSDSEWKERGIAYYVTWLRTKHSIEGTDVNGCPLPGDYGCDMDTYEEYDGDVFDPDTGKKVRGRLYRKVKRPAYPELSGMRMSDGFRANAVFCELTYESAWDIRLDAAFDAIAPVLWMQTGCRGDIIWQAGDGYSMTEYYGVLFDYSHAAEFCAAARSIPTMRTLYVITDSQRRLSAVCDRMRGTGVNVIRLYKPYLSMFRIYGEGHGE